MDPGRSLAFAGVALLVIIFPGPSVLFIVRRSLALGRRSALITVAGNEWVSSSRWPRSRPVSAPWLPPRTSPSR